MPGGLGDRLALSLATAGHLSCSTVSALCRRTMGSRSCHRRGDATPSGHTGGSSSPGLAAQDCAVTTLAHRVQAAGTAAATLLRAAVAVRGPACPRVLVPPRPPLGPRSCCRPRGWQQDTDSTLASTAEVAGAGSPCNAGQGTRETCRDLGRPSLPAHRRPPVPSAPARPRHSLEVPPRFLCLIF